MTATMRACENETADSTRRVSFLIHAVRYARGMATVTVSDTQTVGQRLATARRVAGFDQTAMGMLVGASRPTVSAWERDEREPSFSQVVRWANETGQSLEWLAGGVECATRDSNPQPSDLYLGPLALGVALLAMVRGAATR